MSFVRLFPNIFQNYEIVRQIFQNYEIVRQIFLLFWISVQNSFGSRRSFEFLRIMIQAGWGHWWVFW